MNGFGLRFKFQDALLLPGKFSTRMGCITAFLLLALIFLPITAQASLDLAIAINPEPAAAGDYLNVALTVSNTSDFDRSDVVLTLLYPEHLDSLSNTYISGDATTAYSTADSGEFVTWNIGTLAAGSTTTVTLPPRVSMTTTSGTVIEFAPQASDSSGDETTVSRNVTVTSNRVLALLVAADTEPVQPGETFTYTLTYGHTATSAVAPDMALALPLPDGVDFVSATSGGTLNGNTVQWTLGTLNPGQIGRAQVTVSVDASTALGSLLQTQAVFSSGSQENMISRADTVTRMEDAPLLLLAVEVLPEPAAAGEYLDVKFIVSNASSFDRSEVVLKMRYPEHLDSLGNDFISDDATTWYSTADSREFVTWNLGTLKAGTSKTVSLPPMITTDTPAGTVIGFAPKVYDSSGQVRRVSRCVSVENKRYIELVAAADAEPVQPGEEFTYTLTYGHTATSAVAPDTLLELPLPDGVSFVSATSGGTLGNDIVQWDIGTLAPGQIGRVQVTVAVDDSTVLGHLLQTQAVFSSVSQTDMLARADTVTQVETKSPLLLSASVRPEPVEAGEYLDVALTVSNTSAFDRSEVVLQMRYPEHLDSLDKAYISDGATTWYSTADYREFVTWNIGTLEAGTSKTVTLPPRVTAETSAGTVIELTPKASDSSGIKTMVSRCIAVEDERVFELVLNTDMDAVRPGELLTYTLSYGDRATSASISDAVLSLPLPDNVSFVSATGISTLSNDTVQWFLGTLGPGQVSRKQVTVRVDSAADFGDLLEAQAVLASASQPEFTARADAGTKVVDSIPLLLSMGVTPDPAGAEEELYGELTVTNTSTFDRSDVVIQLRYPEYLDSLANSSFSDDATTWYSTADFKEFVIWNLESLPAGSTKTVTLPPTVGAAVIDGTIIDFDVVVSDATARSRVEHTVLIGQWASELEARALTVAMVGNGSVDSDPAGIDCPGDCTESYAAGTQVTLTAVPDNGWTFKEWAGGCTGTQTHCVTTLSEDLQVTATFIENNSDPKYVVLTDDTPETVASGSDTIVYGSHGANVLFLESGSVARLKNFSGSNTITILSNSSLFTVSRSGANVTFTGSDGTSLVMPVTPTVQTIVFPDKTLGLKISSGAIMLDNQTILTENSAIE